VNNSDLLKSIETYKDQCKENELKGVGKPRIPDYVGKSILLIAERLAKKPNFSSYTFKEEMIGDAIENCVMYFDNFDSAKSKNPFAYFTQIIYYAFLRRIEKEKTQLYVKYKSTQNSLILGEEETQELSNVSGGESYQLYDNIVEFIDKFEKRKKSKPEKKNKNKTSIEELLDDARKNDG
jgi:hypothetical protein